MLKNIVKELSDVENEAKTIVEDAQKEGLKMIEDEKKKQLEAKSLLISECNEKGQKMVEERVDNAHKEAKQIYEKTNKIKEMIKKDTKDKFDQAVKIVLDQIVG